MQTRLAGGLDVFVARLNLDLTQLTQATYLGGRSTDIGHALLLVGDGVYVVGSTDSNNFPGTADGAQSTYAGETDGFIAKLSLDLRAAAAGGGTCPKPKEKSSETCAEDDEECTCPAESE